ncbi:MAG TPA: response regulator [Chloroflexi bacterium]|nr:response regulator [Chloroflexota bacterium]
MADRPVENKKRVLIYIEDEPAMIELVKLILEGHGYQVIAATGGQEGLDVIRETKPDLVLLDLMMPDMNGWDVYQQMKADEYMKGIPVIVVTAKAQNIDKVLGLHVAKVQDYVTKPFSPAQLLSSVRRVLGEDVEEAE